MSQSRYRPEQFRKSEQAKETIKIPEGPDTKSEGLHYEEAATGEDTHTIEIPEAAAMNLEDLAATVGIIPEGEPDNLSFELADAVSDDLMLRIKTLSREQPPLKVFHEVLGEKRFREYTSGVPLNDVAHGCRSMAEEFAS